MSFDGTDRIEEISLPLLMIASSDADTRAMTDDAFERATGTEDNKLVLFDDARHIETYWVDEYVGAATKVLGAFFDRTMNCTPRVGGAE